MNAVVRKPVKPVVSYREILIQRRKEPEFNTDFRAKWNKTLAGLCNTMISATWRCKECEKSQTQYSYDQ